MYTDNLRQQTPDTQLMPLSLPAAMSEVDEFTGAWHFLPDPIGEGEGSEYFNPRRDVSSWHQVTVPATFERTLPSLVGYEGVGWYRRDVKIPYDWRDRRIAISFAGANYRTAVWVNGVEVGRNEDGFLPFEFLIHDQLNYGAENVIVVSVDNTRRFEDVPGRQRGWRVHGGILREVFLTATHHECIESMLIIAEPNCCGGQLEAVVKLAIDRACYQKCSLTLTIGEAESILAKFQAEAAYEVRFSGSVDGVRQWSPDSPQLYHASLELHRDGVLLDRRKICIGFRKIGTQSTHLLLNDASVFLTGFNRHEDSPRSDLCPDHELTREDLLTMKQMGCNFVRLCHYPHHPRTLELCDEIGLLVMAEVPLYWWQGRREGDDNFALKTRAARRQLERMIERDYNHPSIILWAVSNETSEELPEVVTGNDELIHHCKTLDSTRLVTHVSNRWMENPHFDSDDVISLNGYPTYEALSSQSTHNISENIGADWWRRQLAELHTRYPGKPIFISEFGYPALEGAIDGSHGEKAQAQALEQEYSAFDLPYICGTAIWCYADHPWPEGMFINGVTTSPYGVVTRGRRKKLALEVVQNLFINSFLPRD